MKDYFYETQAPSRMSPMISWSTCKSELQLLNEAGLVQSEGPSISLGQQGLRPFPGEKYGHWGEKDTQPPLDGYAWACRSRTLSHTEGSALQSEKMRQKPGQAETRAGQKPRPDSAAP